MKPDFTSAYHLPRKTGNMLAEPNLETPDWASLRATLLSRSVWPGAGDVADAEGGHCWASAGATQRTVPGDASFHAEAARRIALLSRRESSSEDAVNDSYSVIGKADSSTVCDTEYRSITTEQALQAFKEVR